MDRAFLQYLNEQLGVRITNAEQVTGGDINETFVLDAGIKKVFLKRNDDAKADMFEKESRGLEVLINAHAISVPQPLLTGKYERQVYLVMEFIRKGTPRPAFWQEFAGQLAALHRNTAEQFGMDHDNYIGSLPQRNTPCDSWSDFFANHRLLYLIQMAYDQKKCDGTDVRMAERLCNKLDQLFPKEKPSLLHGDLWSGNFMVAENSQPVIYDPAVYYGHREMDIGMTSLFGGFDQSFYSFYNDAWPLEQDWRQRTDLAQLYPLMVHLLLFGGHYYSAVKNILKKFC